MSEITAETIFRRLDLPGARIENEMVFVDIDAGSYYATGEVGADIWDFLDAPRSFEAICDHLLGRYEIDRTTCEAEVRAFLAQLLDAHLIETA